MINADLIIVGSGIAGLFGAIRGAEAGLRVLLVSKEGLLKSNSAYAQGGIAAALGEHDSPELHYKDTMKAGDGLCLNEAVHTLVEDGVDRVKELLDMGVNFDTDGEELALTREGAHSERRILHAGGDATGRQIVEALTDIVANHGNIEIRDRFFVNKLIIDDGVCVGIEGFEENGPLIRLFGRHTLLATGGSGQIFAHTTNPPTATGDGMALAFLAGAHMADMEFIQFHPTALSVPGQNPSFLISEAVRGEGAQLLNIDGSRFMPSYSSQAELAPRDVVSRSITAEMLKTKTDHVFLNFTKWPREKIMHRFPTIYNTCLKFGFDLSKDSIPVSPAAHYYMGGVRTDLWGRTNVENLYAAGEVACTFCHGANRLGSNSLLEGLVFAYRAIRAIKEKMPWSCDTNAIESFEKMPAGFPDMTSIGDERNQSGLIAVNDVISDLKMLMWNKVGILRNESDLEGTINKIFYDIAPIVAQATNKSRDILELRNMLIVSALAAVGAKIRTESRGGHFRTDYPNKDNTWIRHTVLSGSEMQ